jgi:hypothetical protein
VPFSVFRTGRIAERQRVERPDGELCGRRELSSLLPLEEDVFLNLSFLRYCSMKRVSQGKGLIEKNV